MSVRRVAIVGMFLESNAFARTVDERGFRGLYLEGSEISTDARAEHPRQLLETVGFYSEMDLRGPWEPVPIVVTVGGAGGAADHGFFMETIQKVTTNLASAGPLDAVYLCNHGAMTTTEEEDGDGIFFAAVRDVVGQGVPLVATLDPHGNISDLMLESVDLVVAYLTDPHVDQRERGEEAAGLLHELWDGMKPVMVSVKLPIVPPNVSLFTDNGPFGELVDLGQQRRSTEICNVSILGGFAFSDTSKNGLSIIVTGRGTKVAAQKLARDLADFGWANRHRFTCEADSMDEAVKRAVSTGLDAALPATVMSDLGDNCGAGGPANSLWLLEAFHRAEAKGVLIVNFRDRRLVEAAGMAGVGNTITAEFRGDDWERDGDVTYQARATVMALHDGHLVGRRGIVAGSNDRGKGPELVPRGIRRIRKARGHALYRHAGSDFTNAAQNAVLPTPSAGLPA